MLTQLLFIFFIGLILCLVAYFLRTQKKLKLSLYIIGGILIAVPFLVLLYFLIIIFTS